MQRKVFWLIPSFSAKADLKSCQKGGKSITKPGKIDGDPLPKVLADMVQGLVLEPFAPPGVKRNF